MKTKKKALFLDRDGVINEERGDYTFKIEDFIFKEGVFELLSVAKQLGYIFLIITNQSGVAKSRYKIEDVELLHNWMLQEFQKKSIEIEDVFYCPHHPDFSNCLCRKPQSLLFEKAAAKHNAEVEKSFVIGDSRRDIIAGKNIGLKAIHIPGSKDLYVSEADFSVKKLAEIIDIIS